MTDDEDDGPLLFSDDELEWDDEDDEAEGPERFLFIDGKEVGLPWEQYVCACWWIERHGNIRA